jgi:hypothetical protein
MRTLASLESRMREPRIQEHFSHKVIDLLQAGAPHGVAKLLCDNGAAGAYGAKPPESVMRLCSGYRRLRHPADAVVITAFASLILGGIRLARHLAVNRAHGPRQIIGNGSNTTKFSRRKDLRQRCKIRGNKPFELLASQLLRTGALRDEFRHHVIDNGLLETRHGVGVFGSLLNDALHQAGSIFFAEDASDDARNVFKRQAIAGVDGPPQFAFRGVRFILGVLKSPADRRSVSLWRSMAADGRHAAARLFAHSFFDLGGAFGRIVSGALGALYAPACPILSISPRIRRPFLGSVDEFGAVTARARLRFLSRAIDLSETLAKRFGHRNRIAVWDGICERPDALRFAGARAREMVLAFSWRLAVPFDQGLDRRSSETLSASNRKRFPMARSPIHRAPQSGSLRRC